MFWLNLAGIFTDLPWLFSVVLRSYIVNISINIETSIFIVSQILLSDQINPLNTVWIFPAFMIFIVITISDDRSFVQKQDPRPVKIGIWIFPFSNNSNYLRIASRVLTQKVVLASWERNETTFSPPVVGLKAGRQRYLALLEAILG